MLKYHIKYSLVIAITLVGYFLITKLLGLHQYPILSSFNAMIFGGGIFFALKDYKRKSENFRYQDGFQLGLVTGGMATLMFTLFMALYIFLIDHQFANAILDSYNINFNKGSLVLLVTLIIMGFSTTFVLTLAFMQLLKDSWNQNQNGS